MNKNPTVDRESFQRVLASAFVVQQSQMNSQSSSAIVELRRSITNQELAYRPMHLQKVVNASAVTVSPSFGAQLSFPEPEEDRESVDVLSPLANILAARLTADGSPETTLERAIDDTSEISKIAELIGLGCALERSTPPPTDEPHKAADSMNPSFAAARLRTPEVKPARPHSRDPWTPSLGILALGLAFLLGWMLGQVTPLVIPRPLHQPPSLPLEGISHQRGKLRESHNSTRIHHKRSPTDLHGVIQVTDGHLEMIDTL